MAFPTEAATNTGVATAASGTSHVLNLPASISAGDLLVGILGFGGVAPGTVTTTGWSQLAIDANGTTAALLFIYKTATGSEGATLSITTANSVKMVGNSRRITAGTWSGTPEKGTAATGSSTNFNPPSLAPSWGALDTLWIAAGTTSAGTGVSGAPTNYGSLLSSSTGGGGGSQSVGSATRSLNATSDDPGTFTSPNGAWVAQTFAIQPTASATPWFPMGDGDQSNQRTTRQVSEMVGY